MYRVRTYFQLLVHGEPAFHVSTSTPTIKKKHTRHVCAWAYTCNVIAGMRKTYGTWNRMWNGIWNDIARAHYIAESVKIPHEMIFISSSQVHITYSYKKRAESPM